MKYLESIDQVILNVTQRNYSKSVMSQYGLKKLSLEIKLGSLPEKIEGEIISYLRSDREFGDFTYHFDVSNKTMPIKDFNKEYLFDYSLTKKELARGKEVLLENLHCKLIAHDLGLYVGYRVLYDVTRKIFIIGFG